MSPLLAMKMKHSICCLQLQAWFEDDPTANAPLACTIAHAVTGQRRRQVGPKTIGNEITTPLQ